MSTLGEITEAIQQIKDESHISLLDLVSRLNQRDLTTIRGNPINRYNLRYYLIGRKRNTENARKRAERMREARSRGTHTPEDWEAILQRADGRCELCGHASDRLEKDHMVPVYAGGDDSAGNIRALCRPCNGSRDAAERIGRLRSLLGEDASAFGRRFGCSGDEVEDWERNRHRPPIRVNRAILELCDDLGLSRLPWKAEQEQP